MNMQANLSRAAYPENQLSRKHEFHELELRVPEELPLVDLVELYTGIENVMETGRCPILQLVGAGADCAPIALDLAWTAASVMGKRVLLLNCASSASRLPALPGAEVRRAEPGESRAAAMDRMVKVTGQEIYLVDIVEARRRPMPAMPSRWSIPISTPTALFSTWSWWFRRRRRAIPWAPSWRAMSTAISWWWKPTAPGGPRRCGCGKSWSVRGGH